MTAKEKRLEAQLEELDNLKRLQASGSVKMIKGNTDEGKAAGYEFPEHEAKYYHIHVRNTQATRDGSSVEDVVNTVLKDSERSYKAKIKRGGYSHFRIQELYHDPTRVSKAKPRAKKQEVKEDVIIQPELE